MQQIMLKSKRTRETNCARNCVATSLIVKSLLNLFSTCLLYVSMFYMDSERYGNIHNEPIFVLAIVIKAICIVPFVTFEYYLIMFEHIFVDASHYISQIPSQSFMIDQTSPSTGKSRRKVKESSRV